jgi:AcrR family transcriptional regulator
MPPRPRLPSRGAEGRPRRAARERSLTREAIVEVALAIVDADGLDAMTMRRVAQDLDTGAASLYAHFASKEDLLEHVIEHAIGDVDLPSGEPDPARWQEQAKALGRAMRSGLAAHNDIARGCLARIPVGPNSLRSSELLIGILRAGGLPDQVVAFACDLLPLFIVATVYEESLYASEQNTPEQVGAYMEDLRSYFSALPTDRFPQVVALASALVAGSDEGDERFEFGLDVLVRGLASFA